MYSVPHLVIKYLKFYFAASNGKGHGTHSPFVFDFIKNILRDRANYQAYELIDSQREKLKADQSKLEIHDLGAGSFKGPARKKTVSSIAKTSGKPKKYIHLLYRISKYYQPEQVIELGTSLGISTISLAYGSPMCKVWTIEGSRAIAKKAAEQFQKADLNNIKSITGNFDDQLPVILNEIKSVDLCFIDGNHRKESTLRYFKWLLPKTTNNSMLIFDDIHWSNEMEQAWELIREHPAVTATIDLFFMGIVLFRHEFRQKQHFLIRY